MEYICPQMNKPCDIEKCKQWYQRAFQQHEEALSDDNRLYFFEHYGRVAENDKELFAYYIEFGGGVGFREREKSRNEKSKGLTQ